MSQTENDGGLEPNPHSRLEDPQQVTIREAKPEDVEDLRMVLEESVVNPITKETVQEDVEELLADVQDSLRAQDGPKYLVAQTPEGEVVGMMGLQIPGDAMKRFALSPNPGELINAYVAENQRGKGTGRALVQALEQTARDQGFTELVVNSGPRYAFSGWPFWNKMFGAPAGVAKGYYEGQYDAMVWRTDLAAAPNQPTST